MENLLSILGSYFLATNFMLSTFIPVNSPEEKIELITYPSFKNIEVADSTIYQTPLPEDPQNKAVLSLSTLDFPGYEPGKSATESSESPVKIPQDSEVKIIEDDDDGGPIIVDDVKSASVSDNDSTNSQTKVTPSLKSQEPTDEPSESPAELLMSLINDYRSSNGLSPYSYDAVVCSFAQMRAGELTSNFSHTGFNTRMDTGTLPYPGFSHVAENIADTSTHHKAFELWKNSPPHNENMLSGSPYGCVGNVGRFYTLETWTP